MKRRTFIHLTSIAGLSGISLSFTECTPREQQAGEDNTRSNLEEMTVPEMQRLMGQGKLTSRKLTQFYLDQIRTIDENGPALKSVIELNPDALAIADAMDRDRKNGKVRGNMHGIPVLIKDNINTADKMQTTAGSLALEGNIAAADAFIVKRLRDAGAVILGKTNLSEWANFRSSRSSSGWSSRGGQTKNPYVIDRSPCGSSSGSGVAVSANLCAVAVGTETNGSIACPSSMNGVVGIKPTVGLVSRSGIIPISKTQDTAGPIGRTVSDAAALLGALAGVDPNDPGRHTSETAFPADYTKFLSADGLKGKRVGVEKTFLDKHEGVDNLISKALAHLRSQGAVIVEVDFMETQDVDGAESTLLQFEFKDGINKYLAGSNAKVKSLEALIAFNKTNEAEVMPFFKQELFESSQAKGDLNSKEYKAALEKINKVAGLLEKEFEKNNLDALCGPATGAAWCIDPVNGDFWTGYGSYGPAAISGFPSITVPMGNLNDLPVGLSFLGKPFSEPELIGIAYAYEQVSKHRVAPKFLPSIGKN
ncbi:amidase [Dyadobacter sp. CY343]|uniref:amidase n=1 Tax=Dyadobacter sp. CY343 TaxID=2907299 RepID=UPI001F40922D|nr:amidase [Dyadobacter sp. CY343]MCE7061000.1 amidase [Dyadobacter sp. CY343]